MTDKEVTDVILDAVLTVPEVVAMWGKSQKTVMMAIYTDKLAARQANFGKLWLVTRSSCIRHWGKPIIKEGE